ncbi:hypothetical protein CPC08DRAFT_754860 [Agrocybe pediades]|nr:hypothetical protein CPC08DRAFT_754860 [Agrocybe pediades]
MDVLSVATTVFSLCRAINTWVEQLQQREDVINEISHLVAHIRDILEPFTAFSSAPSGSASALVMEGTGELQLSQSIRSLGDTLEKTQEHLIVWKYKSTQSSSKKLLSFLNPGSLIKQLSEDEKRLSRQMSVLLASFAVVGYFHNKNMLWMGGASGGIKGKSLPSPGGMPAPSPDSAVSLVVPSPQPVKQTTSSSSTSSGHKVLDALSVIKDKLSVQFWTSQFGGADFVHEDTFVARLRAWYESVQAGSDDGGMQAKAEGGGDTLLTLPPRAAGLILMRMDEYNSGGVTRNNFAWALGKESLKSFIGRYIDGVPLKIPDSPSAGSSSSNMKIAIKAPLLVWVQEMGINVVQLTSTAEAKTWIKDNAVFLQKHDTGCRIRFITDHARIEVDITHKQEYLNRSAGQELLRYLRGRLYKAPVIVYTNFSKLGKGKQQVKYVEEYDLVGVTSKLDVLLDYCKTLAGGRMNDEAWRGWKEENFRDVGPYVW